MTLCIRSCRLGPSAYKIQRITVLDSLIYNHTDLIKTYLLDDFASFSVPSVREDAWEAYKKNEQIENHNDFCVSITYL